eukprot:gene2499-2941_t
MYNRESCIDLENTCGSCLGGYSGADGSANSPCVLTSSLSSTEQRRLIDTGNSVSCSDPSDCADVPFSSCFNGFCRVPSKTCPLNCSSPLSNCTFVNINSNAPVSSCPLDDPLCDAVCSCAAGLYGSGCQYDAQEFALRQQTRAMLLSALFNQTSVEDATVDTVTSWVSSVRTLSRIPDLLDAAALRHLIDMLSTVVFTSPETSTPLEV